MDEGKLWSLIRNVIAQGAAIQIDYANRGYEEFSARIDAAAAERVADFTKLADAQITELQRSITIRDTEIARLETDLELARRALKTVRRWCMGNGYSASVQVAMKDWIDGGMKYPLPELPEPERSIDATRAGNGGGA